MRPTTRDLLTHEVTHWHQQGLISQPLLDTLRVFEETLDAFEELANRK